MGIPAYAEIRREDRDDVHYRARAMGPDGRQLTLLVVNVSSNGLMARCDVDFEPGQQLRVTMPVAGLVTATIRWSLGGRIGCQFETPIRLATYYEMLAVLLKAR